MSNYIFFSFHICRQMDKLIVSCAPPGLRLPRLNSVPCSSLQETGVKRTPFTLQPLNPERLSQPYQNDDWPSVPLYWRLLAPPPDSTAESLYPMLSYSSSYTKDLEAYLWVDQEPHSSKHSKGSGPALPTLPGADTPCPKEGSSR